MADLPLQLEAPLAARLSVALDPEGKIPAALAAMAPVDGGRVGLLGGGDAGAARLAALGAEVTQLEWDEGSGLRAPDGSFDAVVSWWPDRRPVTPPELAEVDRVLRPGGRQLVVEEYGRDDVSRLLGDPVEPIAASRRNGPFLGAGFRIRVLHCWWSFESMEAARDFLGQAFGSAGASFAGLLRRPRLSYKVAVYHRTREDGERREAPSPVRAATR